MEDYTIVKRIGQGGSGLTYLVRDSSGTDRCMKEFRFGMKKGEEDTFKARELFEREAQTLESLNHPQIPRYLDFFAGGDNGEERLYLVMELVEGKTLDQLLRSKRFNEADTIAVAKKITNILEYLHSFSPPVIHRDIKPKNLIQTPDGTIKLLDFGSVVDKVLQETRFTGTRVGSFGFMAPELMYGKPTPASDVYSLGATLVSLLTGGVDPIELMNSKHRLDFRGKLNVSKKTESLLWDMTEPDLDLRIPNTEGLRQRLYGNGSSNSVAFKTNDDIIIHYDPIKVSNTRFLPMSWDLKLILEKVNGIFSGVRSIINDYGRELVTSPIDISIGYEGKKAEVHSPEEAFAILPTKPQQRRGLDSVKTTFSTSDKKIKVQISYEPRTTSGGYYYSTSPANIQTSLEVDGFTEKNREEYNRLYRFLHGKK